MTQDNTREALALEALRDMLAGWKYIRDTHGDLYGVGWDRAQGKAEEALAALSAPAPQVLPALPYGFETGLIQLLNEARCLSEKTVGNRELAGRIARYVQDSAALQGATALSSQPPAPSLPPELLAIAERLHTQDNRITQDPLFAVQQKRRIYGVDHDYCDNAEWVVDGETWKPDFDGEAPPDGARKVGYIDKWEFVTGCLTEQGCKDFIACNGHNLHKPRIYAYGSYRNAEFIALRKWLMSLPLPSAPSTEGAAPECNRSGG